ncbi:MAG: calcium-binding protein [Pseudomonadota bacterium]
MTLRPIELPNGNVVTVFTVRLFDAANDESIDQVRARVTASDGTVITRDFLLSEHVSPNVVIPGQSAGGVNEGLYHIGPNGLTIQSIEWVPSIFDYTNNVWVRLDSYEVTTTFIDLNGVPSTVSTVSLPNRPFVIDQSYRNTVLPDGTNVMVNTQNGISFTVNANLEIEAYGPFTDFADFAATGSVEEIAGGGIAMVRYVAGNEFLQPPTASTLEIVLMDRVTSPPAGTFPFAVADTITIDLPTDHRGYQIQTNGFFPTDLIQLPNGNFVVAFSGYVDGTNGGPTDSGIWMTIVAPDGTIVMPPAVADGDPGRGFSRPVLYEMDNGTFVMTFEGFQTGVLAIHFSADGVQISGLSLAGTAGYGTADVFFDGQGNISLLSAQRQTLGQFDITATPPLPVISGTPGNDPTLDGTAGADRIEGLGGDDSIRAFGGDDEIIVGSGNSTVEGGFGDDTITVGLGTHVIDGGGGFDIVVLERFARPANETFIFDMFTGRASVSSNLDGVDTLTSIEGVTFFAAASIDVSGTAGANIARTSLGNDTVATFGGNDSVFSDRGDDVVRLGVGEDYAEGGEGQDLIDGGAGFDTILGGDGDDTITGGGNADSIEGGGGHDRLEGNVGTDNIFGGNGNDTILGGFQNDRLHGEAGNDIIQGGGQDDRIFGGDGNDVLNGDNGFDRIEGGAGNDTINGGDQADNLLGGIGNDLVTGGAGFDRLFGGAGNDVLIGNDGTDGLFGEQGDDSMFGGEDNDRFFGGAGNDQMLGGNGDDVLFGGAGFDTIGGGDGNDAMAGNFNADTFFFIGAFGNDTITDFDATNDLERIDLSAVAGITDFADLAANHMAQVGGNVVITEGSNTITLNNVALADLDAADFIFV